MILDRELAHGWDNSERDLLTPRPPTNLTIPSYGGRSIANLAVAIAQSGGLSDSAGLASPIESSVDPMAGTTPEGPIIFLLLDGLGWRAYRRWLEETVLEWPSEWAAASAPITGVFPTTTPAALTTLSTGLPPSQHGILGYRMWVPRWNVVADMVRFAPAHTVERDTLGGNPFDRTSLAVPKTLFSRGLRATIVSREEFAGSNFSQMLYEGAEYVPYSTGADRGRTIYSVLTRARPPPVIFVYWDELDRGSHVRGPDRFLIEAEIEMLHTSLVHLVRRLDPGLARRTTLVLTADHGSVAADPSAQLRLDAFPELSSILVHPPSGDRRGPYLTVSEPDGPAMVRGLKARCLPGTRIVPMEEALGAGLFGPPPFHPESRERLGSFLVLPPVPGTISYRPPGSTGTSSFLFGAHGGTDADEILVPRLAGPLSVLAESEKR